jgi:hypothetical protein
MKLNLLEPGDAVVAIQGWRGGLGNTNTLRVSPPDPEETNLDSSSSGVANESGWSGERIFGALQVIPVLSLFPCSPVNVLSMQSSYIYSSLRQSSNIQGVRIVKLYSFKAVSSTVEGLPMRGSEPEAVFGKAMTSRMDVVPASNAIILSSPTITHIFVGVNT